MLFADCRSSVSDGRGEYRPSARLESRAMERKELGDRQLDALLDRLDNLCDELRALNKRLDSGESYAPIVRELSALNDSLQALAYASLGHQGPQVQRRRRAG
jgi:hypothetical protein